MTPMHSRRETLRMTGFTTARLTYLEQAGVIAPAKRALQPGRKRADAFYTAEQVATLRQLKILEQWFRVDTLRRYAQGDAEIRRKVERFLQS